jgi:hypothetical protein
VNRGREPESVSSFGVVQMKTKVGKRKDVIVWVGGCVDGVFFVRM